MVSLGYTELQKGFYKVYRPSKGSRKATEQATARAASRAALIAGAFAIRIGFCGILYYKCNKEAPKIVLVII